MAKWADKLFGPGQNQTGTKLVGEIPDFTFYMQIRFWTKRISYFFMRLKLYRNNN